MTEQQWLECAQPIDMLTFLPVEGNERRLRLFVCACCRRIWGLLSDARSRKAVEVAELFADQLADDGELASANRDADDAWKALSLDEEESLTASSWAYALDVAADAASFVGQPEADMTGGAFDRAAAAVGHAAAAARWGDDGGVEWAAHDHFDRDACDLELAAQCVLIRDLYGNPFRPVRIDPAWRTSTVVALARVAYEERILPGGELDHTSLAILADALEEAGCSETAILDHLRDHGPHVRGCWPVDLLLDRP
jgi:hypothetical protein